ncbi:type VI secretion system baseplate subunit TssK [Escherichia coli]
MATTRNKVMWQEGMLMRPHHFQQQQRYNDYLDNQRFRAMNDLSWGFTELTLNNELLAQGKIMIDSASGTLPDGTVFSIPDQDALPDPLHPQNFPDERSRNIYLALPVTSDVRNEISDGRRIGRYRLNYADVRDLHSEEGDARTLTLGQLTPRIMSGAEDMSAYITLPLCRISDRHADGSLTLDDDFIPSSQNIQVSKKLRVYLKEVQGAIGGRASDLANRIGSPAQSGIAAVAANMPVDQIQRQFIQQSKISSPEKIRNMVSVQIPGIPLRALMVAPRQLPYHSGFSYFELDKSGQAWTEMAAAGAVALHVSGSFPDLNMQLWAIRG